MKLGYKDINFRLMVTPRESLPEAGWLPINATMETIAAEVEQGYGDGVAAVKQLQDAGGYSNFDSFLANYNEHLGQFDPLKTTDEL